MTASRNGRIAVAFAAVVVFELFLVLGNYVKNIGEPATLVPIETALLNHGSLIAWWFTWLGYAYVLGPMCIALIVVAWRYPRWRGRVAFGIVVLLLCWLGADVFQHFFARPRRLDWVVRHETAFSYPSSHAAIAVGFYLLWAEFVRRSDLPKAAFAGRPHSAARRRGGGDPLGARLALGAHYVTDLAGGILWALAVIAAGLAASPTKVLSVPKGRP